MATTESDRPQTLETPEEASACDALMSRRANGAAELVPDETCADGTTVGLILKLVGVVFIAVFVALSRASSYCEGKLG